MQRDGHVYAALRHVEPRPVSLRPSEERFWSYLWSCIGATRGRRRGPTPRSPEPQTLMGGVPGLCEPP